MTTPDPGLPNLNENRGYGDVIGPGEWNEAVGRINDVEDANADDTAILRGSTATGASTAAKPASATATGRAGQYWVDATGLYVCIAANTWRYFAGATF